MRKLESLDAWRSANTTAEAAYRLPLQPPLSRHFGFADQIRRAAVGIPANIAEGYALGTRPQFVRCLRIALGSAAELLTHLNLAQRLGLLSAHVDGDPRAMADRTISLLIGLLRSLGVRRGQTLPASRFPREP